MNASLCFRAVYLCRDARSTSSQPIRTNQGDTFLRLYQVRSPPAPPVPPPPPPLLFNPGLLHVSQNTPEKTGMAAVHIGVISCSFISAAHWLTSISWVQLTVQPHVAYKLLLYAPVAAPLCATFSLLLLLLPLPLLLQHSLYSHCVCVCLDYE